MTHLTYPVQRFTLGNTTTFVDVPQAAKRCWNCPCSFFQRFFHLSLCPKYSTLISEMLKTHQHHLFFIHVPHLHFYKSKSRQVARRTTPSPPQTPSNDNQTYFFQRFMLYHWVPQKPIQATLLSAANNIQTEYIFCFICSFALSLIAGIIIDISNSCSLPR